MNEKNLHTCKYKTTQTSNRNTCGMSQELNHTPAHHAPV